MINSELSELFGYDYQTLKNYIDNWQPIEELSFINTSDRRIITKLTDEQRAYFDLGWYEFKKAKPELELTYQDFVENKIIINKQPRKLFKYLNDKDLSELVGKYKLPKKDLYIVISTNFDDFLMCSTGNSWTCCTDLRTGDFRYTTIGNIFTKGRFIVYITDLTKTEYLGLESYNKFFRCFGFVNEGGQLVSNIWYPIKEYMSVDDYGFKSVKEVTNKTSKYGIDKVWNKFNTFIYPYLDYSMFTDDMRFTFLDDYYRFHPFVMFKNGHTSYLGDYTRFDGELNLEKAIYKFCDNCGEKKGLIKTYGKVNLCDECLKTYLKECDNCGQKETFENLTFTEDNKFLCKKCLGLKYNGTPVICSCGTAIFKKKESHCKYCRNIEKTDAFKNSEYTYIKNGNVYDYHLHHYLVDGKLPPHLKHDEEVFENSEKYIWK